VTGGVPVGEAAMVGRVLMATAALISWGWSQALAGVGLSDDGGMKFSFDSLFCIGSPDKASGESSESAAPAGEPKEYTYDATGRKVPVRTD
jgi:hypothetical protein